MDQTEPTHDHASPGLDMNATAKFIDHALGLEWRDVPASAQTATQAFLLDTLAVGVAGARAPLAESALNVAAGWGGGGVCTVLGRPGVALPAPQAAFVNAFQIHAQEFDAVHERAVLHPFATAVAALMAETQRSGPHHGRDLLAALVGGVDVVVSLGLAAPSPIRFFRPATAGIFGAVAALARLKRLSPATACDAFGYALAFASGTMQAHVEGKPALPLQVANAARGAIAALDLAEAGFSGPAQSVEGSFGYLKLFEESYDLAPVLEALGVRYRVAECSWKPFPTGRAAHGAIVATQALMRDHGVTADNLQSLVYRAPPLIKRLVGRPALAGMETAYARLCFQWLGAVVLKTGAVELGSFSPNALKDPALLELTRRITVEEDGGSDPAAFVPAVAVAKFRDGREVRVAVRDQWGSPEHPLSIHDQLNKARACFAFAGLEGRHEKVADMIASLDRLQDAGVLFSLASGGGY